MTLDQYLKDNHITQASFAASIGADQSTISRLLAGVYNPSLSLLNRIFKATGGNVTPNDFLVVSVAEILQGTAQ